MFSKLALRNVKRQMGNYLIYFMTVALTVALMFAINNIIFGEQIGFYVNVMPEFKKGLMMIVVFISLIIAFVLGYATSFMLKLRKREFGTYLTLGMTRKNILSIFISETMLICLIALVLGLGLGLFIYQGMTAVMMNLLEMTFEISPYSMRGMLFTIILVVGIFILSSAASAFYLKRVSIYDLIHGDKKVEKTVKHPAVWFAVTIICGVLIVVSCIYFNDCAEAIIKTGANANWLFLSLFVMAASLILFHIGLSRSLIYMLLSKKKICSRGTNTFVLRQLSGTMGSNSIMIGLLAFLLSFTVIGANVSFMQKASQEAALDRDCPYDIVYSSNNNGFDEGQEKSSNAITQVEGEPLIEKYVQIENKISYSLYTTGRSDFYECTRWSGEGYQGLTDCFVSVSDFNALCEPLGYEPLTLDDEFFVVANLPEVLQYDWENTDFEWNGTKYRYQGESLDYPRFCYIYFYIVVPDKAIEGMTAGTEYTMYDVTDGKYDAVSLREELTYMVEETYMGEKAVYARTDFRLREYSRQENNSMSAILVIGALFAAAVFLFMAMAILALKTLSGISDDRKRFEILLRLGVGEREQSRALFKQTFSFFLMPFVVSVMMSIPTAVICANIISLGGFESMTGEIPVISGTIAGVMTLVYVLYYAATYLIAKRAVVCVEK